MTQGDDMHLRLSNILDSAITPALKLLPKSMDSEDARVILLAIGLQESRFSHRAQVLANGGKGPARGFWQFEEGTRESRGGVWGVFLHSATSEPLRLICRALDVRFEPRAIWAELEHNDILAACVARLLLFTDPAPLPKAGEASKSWYYYTRNWRPGKPHPDTWLKLYLCAMEAMQ